jgi:hypothetical protein
MLAELRRVVDESIKKLLQVSPPPIRYWTLYDVLKRDPDDPLVQRVMKECILYPPRVRLLATLRDDGTWPVSRLRRTEEDAGPGPPIGWTYITMLRNIYTLGDYHVERKDGNVAAALERILGWQAPDGHIPGPSSLACPEPHYNGFAMRDLLQFGMEDDARVERLIRWQLGMQRHDGGWNIPYLQDMRYRPEYRSMRMSDFLDLVEGDDPPPHDPGEYQDIPSCIWTTMMAVRGFSWSDRMLRSKEVRAGAEFFLDRFFKRNYHSSFLQSEKNWTKLKYPTYFGSGLLALDLLTSMDFGPEDERMEKPIRWLLDARSKDGFWYRSNRPHPETDLWVTQIAITCLNRYANMY